MTTVVAASDSPILRRMATRLLPEMLNDLSRAPEEKTRALFREFAAALAWVADGDLHDDTMLLQLEVAAFNESLETTVTEEQLELELEDLT